MAINYSEQFTSNPTSPADTETCGCWKPVGLGGLSTADDGAAGAGAGVPWLWLLVGLAIVVLLSEDSGR